jgi:hypothetical protein
MQQKNVLILSIVTLGALGLAALSLRGGDAGAAKAGSARLFPELSERINEVTEVRIEKVGKSTTLKREGGKWKLADRGGYPAEFQKVKELVMRVADLEIEETKTARKSNHAQLAVEWPTTAEEGTDAAEAGLVTMRDASGKELAAVVVGKSEWRGSKPKVFARRASEDQVYLCSPRGTLSVVPDAKSWIEPKFVELANDRVQSVTIEHADGEKVEIARSATNHTQFAVQNMPPGKNERYVGVANGVAQALGYGLQLEDVRPVTEVDFAKEPLAKTRFRSVDGLELVLETAKFEDKTWVRVAASYTPPPEPPAPAATSEPAEPAAGAEDAEAAADGEEAAEEAAEEPAEGTPEAAAEEEKKDVGKEAAELNERLAPWAFEVGSYRTDVLARRMKDLLAEPPETVEDGGLEGALEDLGMDEGAGEAEEEEHAEDHEHGADEGAEPEEDEAHPTDPEEDG